MLNSGIIRVGTHAISWDVADRNACVTLAECMEKGAYYVKNIVDIIKEEE